MTPYLTLLPILTAILLLICSYEALTASIDGIMYAFFADDLEKREALLLLRQDIVLHFEDSNSIYLAYTYFFQEQLRTTTCLDRASNAILLSLFEAGWLFYISAKTAILAESKFDHLESIYLLLSLMLTLDGWAKSLILSEPSNLPDTPNGDPLSRLAGVTEICNTKLLNWRTFHRGSFQPWAATHFPASLQPFLPLRLTAASAKQGQPELPPLPSTSLKSVNDLEPIVFEILSRAATSVSTAKLSLLEFDDVVLPHELPMFGLYPPTAADEPLPPSITSCRNGMFQIQSILHNVRWVHAYSTSRAKNPIRATAEPIPTEGPPASPDPAAAQFITLESLVETSRLDHIRSRVNVWSREILNSTPLPESGLLLINDFYYRTLLDVLLDDLERSSEMNGDAQVAGKPLIEKDNFLTTLYAAIFEVAIFCFGQNDAAPYAFPFILKVTNVQAMDICKVLSSLGRMFSPPPQTPDMPPITSTSLAQSAPKPISSFINVHEEKILCEYLWRPGSSIFAAYNEIMRSYFQYVLSYAGPPHQPRMAIQNALTSPGMADKFNSAYRETDVGSTTNWDSHNIMLKTLRIGCTRIRSMCRYIPVLAQNPVAVQQAEHAFAFLVTQKTVILRGRHIDTIALCTIYAIGLLTVGPSSQNALGLMQALLTLYGSFPECNDAAVNLIRISSDDSNDVNVLTGNQSPGSSTSNRKSPSSSQGSNSSPNGVIKHLTRFVPMMEFYHEIYLPILTPMLVKFQQPTHHGSNHSPSSRSAAAVNGSGPREHNPMASPMTRHPNTLRYSGSVDRFAEIRKRIDFSPYVDPPSVLGNDAPSDAKNGNGASKSNGSRNGASNSAAMLPPAPKTPSKRSTGKNKPVPRQVLLPRVNTPPRTRPAVPKEDEELDEAFSIEPRPAQQSGAPRKRRSPPPINKPGGNDKRPRYH